MGIWNLLGRRSKNVKKSVKGPRRLRGNAFRVPMLETLESRFVLTGPALQGIFTDGMIALHASNDPYHQAPNEFIIQFDANQQIDSSSLGGITFTNGATAVTPGYIGIGSKPNEVVARFDGMAEGTYTLQIAGTGSNAVKNVGGEKFANGQANASATFVVNTAAQIVSVVPQPVTRNPGGGLTQASNQITVYFNQTMGGSVANLAAYQLFNTKGTLNSADDTFTNPISALYNAADKSVTLTFASNLAEGNYRLRVGNAEIPVPAPTQVNVSATDPTDTFAGADAAGNTAVLGTGNSLSTVISGGSIQNTQIYNSLIFPGAGNEPGARNISLGGPNSYDGTENSIRQVDNTPGITVQQFNFKSIYGNTPAGNALVNQITELQKQRVRQAMSLWSNYLGIQFVETADQGWTIAVGDTQAVDPSAPSSAYRGIADPTRGLAIISSAQNWGASDFGGDFQKVAMHELGILLGLERTTDAPDSIMSGDIEDPTRPISNSILFSGDAPLPGYIDITNGQVAQRPESRDIDLYRVQLTEGGTLRLQTIAQRLTPQASLLNSVITVYDSANNIVARNDDYYGSDSFLEVKGLASGVYYIAVTSTGNTNFNPKISDSGMGGTTEGAYQLRMDFDPTAKPSQILDSTNLALDGDGDGIAGGEFNFWFQAGNTIFVDKASDTTSNADGNGSAANPYDNIASALAAAASRIVVPSNIADIKVGDTFTVGNGSSNPVTFMFTDGSITLPNGAVSVLIPANASLLASNIATRISAAGLGITATTSGSVVTLAAGQNLSVRLDLSGSSALLHTPNLVRVAGNQLPSDNYSYLIGAGRPDGSSIVVPQGVTLMIDSGAVLKFENAGIEVGNSLPNINRSGGALQVFGTPKSSVVFTSLYDDANGGDAAGTDRAAAAADWAGVVFRPGADFEKDGIFRNFIAGATFAYGGGAISGSSQPVYSAIDITGSRPTIIGTVLRQNSGAAISADPQSFAESNYGVNTTMNVDYTRLGLSIYGVTLLNNGQNGLAIRSQVTPGSAAQEASGTIHFNDTGIVHIVTQDLLLAQGLNTATDVTYKGASPYVAPNYIVLDSLASSTNDYYVGQQVQITDANGVVLQTRKIIAYDGLTKRAIVDQAWGAAVLGIKPTQRFVISGRLANPGGNLVIDGDTIVKLSNTRIDAQFGSQLLAEGTAEAPVIFTSILDDSYGAGGSFDTTGNGTAQKAAAGNWAGIYFAPTSTGSLDYARLTYAGGTSSIQGTVDSFNPISIIQAQVRIAHSLIANNLGGQAATGRSGLGTNVASAIFVRGAQPVIVANTIRDSLGAAISIDASSLNNIVQGDSGRQTGAIGKVAGTDGNFGAVVVGNVLTNNQINGMNVRGGILTTESIWDDVEIVHVVLNQVFIPNQQVYGGLRLQSSATGSLVVKFQSNPVTGATAGITVTGTPLDIADRIGGTLQVIGTPTRSVVMTTLADDSVGAGVDIFGKAMTDTNNNGASLPTPGSWDGIKIDQYANDRNVKAVVEQEAPTGSTTDSNATPATAENLGTLAANINSGDENNRLGFVVDGSIAYNRSSDVDVYKFNAVAGTEVWFDIDRTWSALGAILELVDANGTVLARSVGNDDASNSTFGNSSNYVQSLDPNTQAFRMEKDTAIGPDTYSTNFINTGGNNNGVSRDPGMRVILPGQAGANQTYFIRVRSNPQPTASSTNINSLTGGLSSGTYELQVRLRQADEAAGTTVRYADVRYATNGIAVSGQPSSPLTGTSGDVEGATGSGQNNTSATAQDLGNILESDKSTISINGFLSPNPVDPTGQTANQSVQDVDWYKFNVNYDFVQAIQNANNAGQSFAAIFDLDYGAGVGRIDTTISVFVQTIDPVTGSSIIQLVLVGRDSNVLDDQVDTTNVNGNAADALSRGSQGNGDPFIGSVQLPAGVGTFSIPRTYYVAISSSGRNPTPLNQFYQHLGAANLTRLEPINSINRIAEDHIGAAGTQPQDPTTSTVGDNLYSNPSSPPYNAQAAANPLFGTPANDGTNGSMFLGANATPLTLGDVIMWNITGTSMQMLNSYTGATQIDYENGAIKSGDNSLTDLAMRSDGIMYAFARNTGTNAPSLVKINPNVKNGAITSVGSISVTNESFNTIDGLAIAETSSTGDPGDANGKNYQIYGVATSNGRQILIRMRANDANTSPDNGFGLVGVVNVPAGAGNITGGASINAGFGPRLFFVTSNGFLLEVSSSSGNVIQSVKVAGVNGFEALTRMPRNVQGAAFTDILMAATTDGRLVALGTGILTHPTGSPPNPAAIPHPFGQTLTTAYDLEGNSVPIFAGGRSSVFYGGGVGIAFTPIDYNIWHVTTERSFDPGHGVPNSYDQSRNFNTNPGSTQLAGGQSFAFNLDARESTDVFGPSFQSPGAVDSATGSLIPNNNFRFRTDILDSYDLPGGAWGSLTTNTFSLQGYTSADMPTLYFNYYLQTQDKLSYDAEHGFSASDTMLDSMRVFVSDDGVTWHQVATNNSTPSNYYGPTGYVPPTGARQSELPEYYSAQGGQYANQSHLTSGQNSQTRIQELFDDVTAVDQAGGNSTPFADPDAGGLDPTNLKQWRQARIDLGDFAGMSNLRIRFDFSTAGDMNEPTKMRVSVPNVGGNNPTQNLALLDGKSFSLTYGSTTTVFELDTDGVLNVANNKRVQLNLVNPNVQLTDEQLAAQIAAAVNAYTASLPASQAIFGAQTIGVTGVPLGTTSANPAVQGIGADQNIIRFDLISSDPDDRPRIDLSSNLQQFFSASQVPGTAFGAQPAQLREFDADGSLVYENLPGDSYGNFNSFDRTQNNHFEGVYIDDLIIGFASRGEMVTQSTSLIRDTLAQPTNQDVFVNAPVNPNPNAAKPAGTGSYHLEIRPGVSYGEVLSTYDLGITNPEVPNPGENPRVFTGLADLKLNQSFDINDRMTHAFDIVAVAGKNLLDGQAFSLNDGAHTVTFEFDKATTANPNGNGVQAGRVKIAVKASDEAWQVADAIALAIRSATGQGFRLDIGATTSNLDRVAFDKIVVDQTTGLMTYATPNPNSPLVTLVGATDVFPKNQPISSGITAIEYGADPQNKGQSTHYGDTNTSKQQGTIIIESSRVTDSAAVGIALTSERDTNGNRTYPGVPTSFPTSTATTTAASAVPGVVLINNIIAGFGQAGIAINGDASLTGPTAAVPFARVANNTIYGSLLQTGIGIVVGDNASPTLINNIIANTATAIQTSSKSSAVLVGELYSNNKANRTIQDATTQAIVAGDIGAQSLIQSPTDQIFVNPAVGNFYLRPGTKASPNLAIDSAIDVLGDRSDLAALRVALGMGASSILAPDKDINNQSRADDPLVTTPPGVGANSLKDRGAVERADFIGPYASLQTPKDNGPNDTNLGTNDVSISGVVSTKFEIKLADVIGLGVDPTSVQANDVTLTLGGQTLVQGVDYLFSFDDTKNVIVLTSAGAQFRAGTYQIILNNSATGITDKAGNLLLANRTDGRTTFNITIALNGPTGILTAPQDGGAGDLNPIANDVTVKTASGLTTLEVSLAGGVGGIKDSSVDATKVRLLKNGLLQTLGVDYLFSYDPATDKIRLTSIGQLFVPGQYSIILDNSLDKGIFDNSGNAIQPNRNNGSVVYNATLLLTGPIGSVSAPADNGSTDTDPLLNHVQVVSTTGLAQIDVKLTQDLAAINSATVTASTVKLFRDGVLLVRGTDYNFVYTAGTSTISLSLINATKVPVSYKVVLDNSAATGIRDLSGARLQPNESDGSTNFYVSVVAPGPVASLINPKDGSAIDRDPAPNNVLFYSQTAVSEFQVLLGSIGFALNDATVDASKLTLSLDGVLLQLGSDYTFSYQAATDTITIAAASGEFLPGQYVIKLDNSATGILDVQGNQLRPNRASGTTELIIAFTPPGPISIPQGIFIANLGLSDISGVTYVGFNLQGDPLSKLTVTVDAKVDPSGATTQLINTTLFVSANGLLTFSRLLPIDLNGESLTITVTDEFGQVITASSLIGPRATIRRAYVSSLYDNLLGRDGVLNETTDQFTPIESLVTYPAMAQALLTSTEYSNLATSALVKSIMGRTATPQEIATYSAQFLSTGSFNQARISLLTSDEFAKIPPDAALNYNDANHRALVTSYVQRVYAVLLPGVALTPTLLSTQVQNVFEGGRRWIITNNQDGGILASAVFRQTLVNQTYQKFLGRNATGAEQSASANLSDRDITKSAVTTTDYIYTQLAQSIYREYLQLGKGQVDPAKVQALVQSLKAGSTENEARADVLASTEFRTNAGGTLPAFVENAYRQILLRAPSAIDISNGISFVNANGGDIVAGRRAYALLLLSDPSYSSNSQGTLITSGIQSAAPGSPVINGISQVQVTEGQTVQFVVSSTTGIAGPVSYNLAVAPEGAKIDSQTGKFTWTTPDSFNGIVPVTVEAVSKSNSQLRSMRTFLVEVSNTAPTAMIYASSSVIGGTEQSITLTADDPSSVDADANFTFDIDWNGDGITDQTVEGPSGVVVKHVFNSPGAQTINVTATDKDGGVSEIATTTVFVGGIFVQPDPNDNSKQNLVIVGTDGADVMTISQDVMSGPVTVTLSMLNGLAVNMVQQFANITGRLEVFTAGGDDIIRADGVKFTSLKIDSGAGDDSVVGGFKNDTILGGEGNDTIWGLIGSDSIDGGAGNDQIFGDQPGGYGFSQTSSNLGNDTIFGGTGNDTIYGDSDGGEGKSDYIDAGDGDDLVIADGPEGSSTANDTIYGGNGNDLIFADHPSTPVDLGGKDSVDGGAGTDIIYGGGGADTLAGGSGSDLVIAGYVNNLGISTFQNVQKEWVSADSFLDRRAYISAQKIFGGANGSSYLVPGGSTTLTGNVLDDNSVDSIFAGNDTDGDWLLATATLDELHDVHLNEDIVDSLIKT